MMLINFLEGEDENEEYGGSALCDGCDARSRIQRFSFR